MWNAARARVLCWYADEATAAAQRVRERVALFPDHAVELQEIAAGLDRYAAACRAAVADPSLPVPEYAGTQRR